MINFHHVVIAMFSLSSTGAAMASDVLHIPPFDFLFGNHIDTHQETKLKLNSDGSIKSLKGRLYIIYTGDIDNATGLPIARHPRGADKNEACGVDVDCVVGWTLDASPSVARFLYHAGVNGNDHPVWLVNRVDIPQPSNMTHFHWITTSSSDPRAGTVPAVCDQKNAGELEKAGAANTDCPGWYVGLHAVEDFVFEHGGEKVVVQSGVDNATHINLVSNYAIVEGITATRGDGGH